MLTLLASSIGPVCVLGPICPSQLASYLSIDIIQDRPTLQPASTRFVAFEEHSTTTLNIDKTLLHAPCLDSVIQIGPGK